MLTFFVFPLIDVCTKSVVIWDQKKKKLVLPAMSKEEDLEDVVTRERRLQRFKEGSKASTIVSALSRWCLNQRRNIAGIEP